MPFGVLLFGLGGVMTDWENIISFESLYKAHRRARLGKRHKKEVILFESNLSQNLWELHYDLKYKKYNVSGYHNFTIYDPKEREIQAISYRDRIVQHSLCDNYLSPLLEKHLIYDNTACRKNKGTSFAIARLRKFMLAHYKKHSNSGYFVKIDVKKYFDNINHTIIKNTITKLVKDKDILELIYTILDSYNFEQDKGLPMGNQTSQCFALLYLDCLDRYFKEVLRAKYYIRYMDDIIAIVPSKAQATICLSRARDILLSQKLNINPKSQIIAFHKGIEFLGWRFFVQGRLVQKVRRSTQKRILSKAKVIRFQSEAKKLPSSRPQSTLNSYIGFLEKGNSHIFLEHLRGVLAS